MRTSVAPLEGATDAQDLQPIRLCLLDMVLTASVSPGDERMTDILERGGELRVLPEGAPPWELERWLSVPIDDIEWVIPPPHVSSPEKQVERQHYPVRLRLGEWDFEGTAHLRPGAEQDAILAAAHPFLPLTDVTMRTAGGGSTEAHEVVIVNIRHAEFVVD